MLDYTEMHIKSNFVVAQNKQTNKNYIEVYLICGWVKEEIFVDEIGGAEFDGQVVGHAIVLT
jgi:hypothetical protein